MKPSPLRFSRSFRLVHFSPLLLFESGDAGQRAPFHPFEEGAARRRDEGEIVRHAGVVESRDRVAAAGDRDQRASLVSAAAVCASATVAASNGGVSNAPSGPFQTRVRQVFSTSASASTAAGPTSRIISSAATSWTLQVRMLGGLGANSFATTTS